MVVGSIGHPRIIALERIRNVRVDGGAVSLHLPVRRNGNLLPGTHVEVGLIEISRAKFRALHPMELPHTIERLNESRLVMLVEGRGFAGEWAVGSASWFLVDSVNARVLPIACHGSGVLRRQH